MHFDDNTGARFAQDEILIDRDQTGKPRPWAQHRTETDYMAAAYDEVNQDKAAKLRGCATWLEFAQDQGGALSLHNANFCRIRLCPMCQWRRSLKIWSQTTDLVAAADREQPGGCGWIMLTLTQRNIDGFELAGELDRLYRAWSDLTRRKEFKRAILGFMRVLEVTHNTQLGSTAFDTFHPHFHALLCVRRSYFHSRDYISHAAWQRLWADVMELDYLPSVEVHAVKGDRAGAIAEVSKYATKPDSVLTPEDWDLTVRTVEQLDHDLAGRRLIAYGGNLRRLHHDLHLDSVETGDLIRISEESEAAGEIYQYISYSWAIGYRAFIKGAVRKGGTPYAERDKARAAARGETTSEVRANLSVLVDDRAAGKSSV